MGVESGERPLVFLPDQWSFILPTMYDILLIYPGGCPLLMCARAGVIICMIVVPVWERFPNTVQRNVSYLT